MNVHECVRLCVSESRYCFQDDNIFGNCLDHPSSEKPKDKLPLTDLTLLPHCFTFILSVPNYLIVPLRSWSWHQLLAKFSTGHGHQLSSPHLLPCAALLKYNRMYSKWIPGASSQCSCHPFKLYSKDSEGRAWQKQVYCVLSQNVFTYQAGSSNLKE